MQQLLDCTLYIHDTHTVYTQVVVSQVKVEPLLRLKIFYFPYTVEKLSIGFSILLCLMHNITAVIGCEFLHLRYNIIGTLSLVNKAYTEVILYALTSLMIVSLKSL